MYLNAVLLIKILLLIIQVYTSSVITSVILKKLNLIYFKRGLESYLNRILVKKYH